MSKSSIAFRTSVNGYNKSDVYKYLESLNRDIIARDEASKCEISKISAELEVYKAKAEANISALKEDNARLSMELEEKEALISELDRATVKISLEIDELAKEYNAVSNDYLETAKSLEGLDELKRKAQAYDRISERIKPHTQSKPTPSIYSSSTVKADVDKAMSNSTSEMLEYIQETQKRFNEAILNAQKETAAIKACIDAFMNSSEEKNN